MKITTHKAFILISLFLMSNITGFVAFNTTKTINSTILPIAQAEDDLTEFANVWINAEGWYDSYYGIEGTHLDLAGINFGNIEQLYPELFYVLESVHWNFENRGPEDYNPNVNIEFRFFEEDLGQAQAYGDWIMSFVNALSVTGYYYSGNWIEYGRWNPFTNQNENLNVLMYEGFIEWPNMLNEFAINIPRDQGGLASTVNVSECDALRWNWWHWDSGMTTELGFAWYGQVDKLEGNFQFDLKDLVHVENLIKPNGNDGQTHMGFTLPEVSNLQINPETAPTFSNRSNERNPWELDDHYSIDLTLDNSLPSVSDFNISFDYEFVPQHARPKQEFGVRLNPYGYALQEMQIRHENATLIDFLPYLDPFDTTDLWEFEVNYYPEVYPWHDFSGNMHVRFINASAGVFNDWEVNDAFIEYQVGILGNLTEAIEIDQGWEVVDQYYHKYPHFTGELYYPAIEYYISFNHTWTPDTWANLWNSTWIYSVSPYMQNASLAAADYVQDRVWYNGQPSKHKIKDIRFQWNPLYPDIQDPTKMFDESSGTRHTIDTAALLNMAYLETSDEFYVTNTFISIPEHETSPYFQVLQPERTNGYGFGYWTWHNWYDYGPQQQLGMDLYVNDAHYWESGLTTTPNNLVIEFDYDFYPDTVDVIPPGGYLINDSPYNGTAAMVEAKAWDNSYLNWWNENYYDSPEPRFPESGIDTTSMTLDFYFSELAIDFPEFHWGPYSMNYHLGTDTFWKEIDTTTLPDGEFDVHGKVADNDGNWGYFSDHISIDNYNDSYLPPEIALASGSPLNESHLEGVVDLQFNITDDVDVFAAVATVGAEIKMGTGYVLEEISPGVFELEYNTQVEPENEDRWIVVTGYDMDGHKAEAIYKFTIDNIPAGEPPFVEIVAPAENAELNGTVLFQVNATDDNGISSIQGKIDDRTPTDMIYNAGTGYYELEYNVSKLVNGTHSFTVIVFDVDDADTSGGGDGQHMVTRSISFIALTDIDETDVYLPPEIRNVFPGNITSGNDIISGDLTFSLDVKDDTGIETVQIYLGTATDYEDISVVPDIDSVNFQNYQTIAGFPQNMEKGATDTEGWTTYEQEFNTTTTTNGIYIVRIQVGDTDPEQHQIDVYFLILINNEAATNPFGELPGYPVPILLMGIAFTIGIIYRRNQR